MQAPSEWRLYPKLVPYQVWWKVGLNAFAAMPNDWVAMCSLVGPLPFEALLQSHGGSCPDLALAIPLNFGLALEAVVGVMSNSKSFVDHLAEIVDIQLVYD